MPDWSHCNFLTCSVLPVRRACNCRCPFCFSKSSTSALAEERAERVELHEYFAFARERGARRLVITGGGEPLLRRDAVLAIVREGRAWFPEIALFTNAALLDSVCADDLAEAGL